MPSADDMRKAMMLYLQHVSVQDVDAVLALFSETISVEDPVAGGAGTHVEGREAVAAFFRKGFSRTKPVPTLTGPIRTTLGNEAAMPFTLRLELAGRPHEIDIIDVMTFDENGKISRLRAFWNPDEIRALDG
jgi:steroid delta-isomerase